MSNQLKPDCNPCGCSLKWLITTGVTKLYGILENFQLFREAKETRGEGYNILLFDGMRIIFVLSGVKEVERFIWLNAAFIRHNICIYSLWYSHSTIMKITVLTFNLKSHFNSAPKFVPKNRLILKSSATLNRI